MQVSYQTFMICKKRIQKRLAAYGNFVLGQWEPKIFQELCGQKHIKQEQNTKNNQGTNASLPCDKRKPTQ
jgi:hypothetical protein